MSSLMLDTHALLWWLNDEPLADAAQEAVTDPDNVVMVSVASIWEIGIKVAAGRLDLGTPLVPVLRRQPFDIVPVTLAHAEAAATLPRLHGDPFDRMLVAQAKATGSALVTRDRELEQYGVDLLRC